MVKTSINKIIAVLVENVTCTTIYFLYRQRIIFQVFSHVPANLGIWHSLSSVAWILPADFDRCLFLNWECCEFLFPVSLSHLSFLPAGVNFLKCHSIEALIFHMSLLFLKAS